MECRSRHDPPISADSDSQRGFRRRECQRIEGPHREAAARKAGKRAVNRVDAGRTTGELDAALKRGSQRYLTAPDAMLEDLSVELSRMRAKREHVAGDIDRAEKHRNPAVCKSEVEAAISKFTDLLNEAETAPPKRLREVLRRLVQKVEFRWCEKSRGKKRVMFKVESGTVQLQADISKLSLVSLSLGIGYWTFANTSRRLKCHQNSWSNYLAVRVRSEFEVFPERDKR